MWGHKCSQGQFTYSPAKGRQLPQEAETGCRGTEGRGEGPGCGDKGRRGGAVLTERGLAWTWDADAAPIPHVRAMELASAGPLWDLTELPSHSARPLVPLALGSNSPTLSLAPHALTWALRAWAVVPSSTLGASLQLGAPAGPPHF